MSGNHEFYEGLEEGVELTQQSGFQVLRGEHTKLGERLYVAGVDDDEALDPQGRQDTNQSALDGIPEDAFTILLKHRPSVSKSIVDRFDLQLSGHTHWAAAIATITAS